MLVLARLINELITSPIYRTRSYKPWKAGVAWWCQCRQRPNLVSRVLPKPCTLMLPPQWHQRSSAQNSAQVFFVVLTSLETFIAFFALCCLWIVWTIGRFASKHRQTRISSPRSTQHRFIILITQLLHSFDILGHKLPICANYYKQHFGSWLVLNLGISLPRYIDSAPYTFSSHLSSQYCRFD